MGLAGRLKHFVAAGAVALSLGCTKNAPQPAPMITPPSSSQRVQASENTEITLRARRLEEQLQQLVPQVQQSHLCRDATALRSDYERVLNSYQRTCRTIQRTQAEYTPQEFPTIAELLERSSQAQVAENVQRLRSALACIDESVGFLSSERMTIRQFMREIRAYEGSRGRYMQAFSVLKDRRAVGALFIPTPPQNPTIDLAEKLLQMRGFCQAVPTELLALTRNQPFNAEAEFNNSTGDFEYGFSDTEEGMRR